MSAPPPDEPPRRPPEPPWREFARAPLVPVAVAATVGLVADRYLSLSLDAGYAVAVAGLAGWLAGRGRNPAFAAVCLWGLFAGLAAAHHHTHRHTFAADDVGEFARTERAVAKVRGVIEEPPAVRRADRTDGFGPARRVDRAATVLAVTGIDDGGWRPASGRLRLSVERVVGERDAGFLDAVGVGDEVEVVGQLARPATPSNPGEWDYAGTLLDRRIRAELRVTKAADAVARLDAGGRWSAAGGLAVVRGRLTRLLDEAFPPREAALARALLLGDGTAMDRDEWDAFARTGVIHVLAISGQHLVVLAGFVWVTLRVLGVRRRHGAWLVLAVVGGYAVLTGLRPSALRATVMVAVVCGGLLLRRPVSAANAFALAWLAVLALDPTDPFTAGCQLSFLSVFVLVWGVGPVLVSAPPTPLERLIDESRSAWVRGLRWAGRATVAAYAVTLALTAANAPLVVARQNVVPPVGVIVGPPLVLLTAVALLAGFLLLLAGPVFSPAVPPLAAVTGWCLAACDRIVGWADAVPGGAVYVPDVPGWWVAGFYVLLVAPVLLGGRTGRRLLVALVGWACVGLVGLPRGPADELRVTALAVGHGGCTVIESPDGRVLVYDAGTMAGPDAVRRVVAPFLWSRGISRVDELLLSHADLDHFNGVAELLKRFPVGRTTLTPSFALKPTAEVAEVLLALRRHGVPTRTAAAGDRFAAGPVELEVLHPPAEPFAGTENERSLVLRLTHRGHALLLTGDLEKAGTRRLLALPPQQCDVLFAPHHGSRAALPPDLAAWASPRLVVASRGGRFGNSVADGDAGPGVPVWDTFTGGAVTLRSNPTGLTAEAFRSGERRVVARGSR
jgi:competence protein ComEC